MRIGLGEDIHRLVEGRPLFLGGVKIPFEKGLLGHSDADCVLHAIMDSILGALGKGDIGVYFPPNDPAYEGADSKQLLKQIVDVMKQEGYEVSNIDVLITAERPKLNPHRDAIRSSIASLLEIDASQVGLQLMTNEGLDALGRGEAIASKSIVLLKERGK